MSVVMLRCTPSGSVYANERVVNPTGYGPGPPTSLAACVADWERSPSPAPAQAARIKAIAPTTNIQTGRNGEYTRPSEACMNRAYGFGHLAARGGHFSTASATVSRAWRVATTLPAAG
jgi:hypothetical protein